MSEPNNQSPFARLTRSSVHNTRATERHWMVVNKNPNKNKKQKKAHTSGYIRVQFGRLDMFC